MKTTVELPDDLLQEVHILASAQGRTMKSLLEEGLRLVIERHRQTGRFQLADASVDGFGLSAEFRDAGWDDIRRAAYGSRQ